MSETWIQTSQVIAWDKGRPGEEWEEMDSGPRARAAVRRQRDIHMYVYVFTYVCTLTLGLGGGWQRRFLIRKKKPKLQKATTEKKTELKRATYRTWESVSEGKQQSSAKWGQEEDDKPAGRIQSERERDCESFSERKSVGAVQGEGSAGQSQKERDWKSLSKRNRAKAAKQCKAVQDKVKGRERAEEWQIVCLHESMFLKCGR